MHDNFHNILKLKNPRRLIKKKSRLHFPSFHPSPSPQGPMNTLFQPLLLVVNFRFLSYLFIL